MSVLSSQQNAVRRNSDCPSLSALSIFLILLLAVPGAFGQGVTPGGATVTLDDAVQQLADRVAAIPNLRGPLRVQYFQEAGFSAETGRDWQETFRKELEKSRLNVTEDAGANLLRVGLAETPTEVVLSAGMRLNEKEEVRFVTLARTALAIPSVAVSPIRVDRQLLYQSSDRILDAAYQAGSGGQDLVILANLPNGLTVLRLGSGGAAKQSIQLSAAGARAERANDGQLLFQGEDVSVVFAGRGCHFSWTATQDVSCRAGKVLQRGAGSLRSACGDGAWKLIADGADWFAPELLQVVPDGGARKGSTALLSDFPGPILSVNVGGEQKADSALVVTRNLRTGNYEVYKITLACGN